MKQAILGTVAALSLLTAVPSFAGELYDQGLRDRILWENWFLSLYGDKRTGAEYWASQRSLSNPGNCLGTSDFQRGCSEAKARLTPFDVVRKSQPEYRLGWNAYIPPASRATGSPSLPPWEQEERTRQQEITTRALEAENARRQADLQSREIAARAARAEADRVKAEVSRRKAEQEATDARAEARLRYEQLMTGQVNKKKERGYNPISFEDYLLDRTDLEKSQTKIAIHGYYKTFGHLQLLLRSPIADIDNDDARIILLTENAERDARKYFLTCRDNAAACPVTVLGKITKCARTDKFGAKTSELCFMVDDSWNVAEPGES